MNTSLPGAFSLRHDLRPGDLGAVVYLHGAVYSREYRFDPTFEAYVAGPMSEFVRHRTDRDRLWIAEWNQGHGEMDARRHRLGDSRVVGAIAIVGASEKEAQLRWFLVDPAVRGLGIGKKLIHEAVAFSKEKGYESIFLWTVSALAAAAKLYKAFQFEKVEEKPVRQWGVEVVEERYALRLTGG